MTDAERIKELEARITDLLMRVKVLEQHDGVTRECLNAQADGIDMLNKEVFGLNPVPEEEEDDTPDGGGDDLYEQWKDDRDDEEGLL